MQSSGSGASRPRFPYHAQRSGRKGRRAAEGGEVGPIERERDLLGGGSCWRRWSCSAADSIERPTRPIEAPRSVSGP